MKATHSEPQLQLIEFPKKSNIDRINDLLDKAGAILLKLEERKKHDCQER